jgi:tetratricopeptide (TPR) repeat protein
MKQFRTFIFLTLVCCFAGLRSVASDGVGKNSFDFNNRCKTAFQSLISLRIQEGNALLLAELRENPENLIPIFLSNYDDCLTLLFNGDPKEFTKRKPNFSKRLDLLEKGDKNSPWYRYTKAALYFQWAAVDIRFNETFNAGTAFRKSFLLLKENQKLFPTFRNNQVLLGIEQALIGTIPDNYKWISSLLGMKGDVKKGVALVVDFLGHKDGTASLMREEAIFFYCYLKYNLLSDHKAVWKYMDESVLDFRNNQLFVFMKANFALNDNKASIAEQVLNNRNQNGDYLESPIFNYQMGCALLLKVDDDCIPYFQKFLNRYTGKMFVKDTYQKMSFYYQTVGNKQQALLYKNKIKTSGTADVDADKQAQRYAINAEMPFPMLLKSRLLCDGGYFEPSLAQLKMIQPNTLSISDKLEYNYRYARIFTLTGQYQKAIPFYEMTIQIGINRPEHFAARSALELGQLYEQQGQKDKAIAWYQKCISMKNHDYKSSLDQKAKAGINRLGGAT